MARIRITPEYIRERAVELRHLRDDQSEIANRITKILDELNSELNNKEIEGLAEHYNKMQPQIENFCDYLNTYANYLDKLTEGILEPSVGYPRPFDLV